MADLMDQFISILLTLTDLASNGAGPIKADVDAPPNRAYLVRGASRLIFVVVDETDLRRARAADAREADIGDIGPEREALLGRGNLRVTELGIVFSSLNGSVTWTNPYVIVTG
jgi:hypothetical protein